VLLVAHAGHWLLWVLYAVPVLIVLGSIVAGLVRGRHAPDGGAPAEDSSTVGEG
jgi:hypothetical protein